MIKFTINCNPPKSTHQGSISIMKRRDGTQFVGKMGNSKGKATKNTLLTLFSPHAPKEPMEGPVSLKVVWAYGWRKSESKKAKLMPYKWCDTRPDCDNLSKMVEDVMTDLAFWKDDSQVACLHFEKVWCSEPHISITIEELVAVERKD